MYNQRTFNQSSFNTAVDDATVFLTTDAFETISGYFGVAILAYIQTNAAELITAEAMGTAGVTLSTYMAEELDSECSAIGSVMLMSAPAEIVSGNTRLGATIYAFNDVAEVIDAIAALGARFRLETAANETIDGILAVGAQISASPHGMYEMVSAVCSAEATDILEIDVDISLSPGQTLVVDSENLIVLLDGENIVARHSGRWCELDRKVRSVVISTGTAGAIESSILYTERWL